MTDDASLPPLVYWGDDALMAAQPAVTAEDLAAADWSARLEILAAAMDHYGGIGIAAPQIGWAARVFCYGIADGNPRYPDAGDLQFRYWINPRVVASRGTNWAWEGCLSVPGLRGWIGRPAEVDVVGQDETGAVQEQSLTGWAARVFQHELDHLDGVLMPRRVVDPVYVMSDALMAEQAGWRTDWPSPGAYASGSGELCDVR
ncbi:MAG: peptide deformylase [Pseudomonadota bacterium]